MSDTALPTDRLKGYDFASHNEEQARVWEAYWQRKPIRTPVMVGTSARFFMFHPEANDFGMDFERYSEDADAMFESQLRFQRWSKFNLLQDAELGLPEKWQASVDFQSYYEAAWLGCQVVYVPGQVPASLPAFVEEPERIMENGLPDPFGGLFARGLEFFQRFQERASKEEFLGRPIEALPPWTGTDGPMTVACDVFGAEFVCEAMVEEPDRLHRLLDFITEAIVRRMTAWRKLVGQPIPQDRIMLADDHISLISIEMYREHILPYHRRLFDTFATSIDRGIHLCGNASRHFPTLHEELGVEMFETGFPIDFGKIRRDLGPSVRILGGPHIELLRTGSVADVEKECIRILGSGVLDGGLFVLREGNNLAPGTPLENVEAMYRIGREYGLSVNQP